MFHLAVPARVGHGGLSGRAEWTGVLDQERQSKEQYDRPELKRHIAMIGSCADDVKRFLDISVRFKIV